ncbi:NAD(P)H-dependent oxidoreductase [Bradyrhizobium barranii subsp. apii]|uniref:NAD(P)H-dependent oxidoreductase n=1 Tax=Bradyrhizobium barranii TaxID=2992140 RepID=UPI001AA1AEFD|nr:NAD(P)H-dependent oxidoreductase [Bradyrhizobium barranii]UPT93117.1 NAD(P)H-dependent oxidoreductase [Bradyrhizobium barranii subsp. apii]
MRTSRIVGFCGNSWRPAKSRMLVEAVAADLQAQHGLKTTVLDLVDAGCGIAGFTRTALDDNARAVVEAIEQADGFVIGCPVFQGSYPGLFKHVFDLIEPSVLRNRPVLLTAVGGGLRHSLVVEHQLRPLFGFFEACTVSTAIYSSSGEIVPGEPLAPMTAARLANAVEQFASLLSGRQEAAA